MAISIEQFTAPGKYYVDKSFEEIEKELNNPPFVYVGSKLKNYYQESKLKNGK